jgi:hypothetical protein
VLNSVSSNFNDAIYVGGSGSVLTLRGSLDLRGFDGVLRLNVAQPGAVLNLRGYTYTNDYNLTKTGAGTLNISNTIFPIRSFLVVRDGTVNFLPGASLWGQGLSLFNENPDAGTTVTVNLHTSMHFGRLTGGASTSLNLLAAGSELSLSGGYDSFRGSITESAMCWSIRPAF